MLYLVNDQCISKTVIGSTKTTYEYYLYDANGHAIAIEHYTDFLSWEYYAFGAERECRLIPDSIQAPGYNTNLQTTEMQFIMDQANFYLYDHLGNTRVVYAPHRYIGPYVQHTVAFVGDYFPYGKVLREYINGEEERYLTTQHERDRETGLDYRGARYYDSDVARFLSTDPWQDKYPAWSTYNYCMGNPIVYVDPTGKGADWIPEIKNNRLVVTKEEGDDAKTLATFLHVSQESADKLYSSMDSKGSVDVGEFHGAWVIE